MLYSAVLVLAISSLGTLSIDYEYYEDAQHCSAVSDFVNDYNKDNPSDRKITSVCLKIEEVTTNA